MDLRTVLGLWKAIFDTLAGDDSATIIDALTVSDLAEVLCPSPVWVLEVRRSGAIAECLLGLGKRIYGVALVDESSAMARIACWGATGGILRRSVIGVMRRRKCRRLRVSKLSEVYIRLLGEFLEGVRELGRKIRLLEKYGFGYSALVKLATEYEVGEIEIE